MHDHEIYDLYDRKLNMTIDELSRISGRSRSYLKRLLMGPMPKPEHDPVPAYIAEGLGEY
jgi:hypothetical protein